MNWINEDDAVDLSSFYGHVETNGYLVDNSEDDPQTILDVMNEVEAMFYPTL